MGLFKYGLFRLSSGHLDHFRIDCEHLNALEWSALAQYIAERVRVFRDVVGVETGGEALAKFLKGFAQGDIQQPLLIVDDVWTTGASMRKCAEHWTSCLPMAHRQWIGWVVFSRGKLDNNVESVFHMPHEGERL